MGFDGVDTDTNNNSASIPELRMQISKSTSFLCTTRRVVFGIKIKDDKFAFEIRQANLIAIL